MPDSIVTEEMVEAAAIVEYNRVRTARHMRPVDYIGANNTPELNAIRRSLRAALTAVAPLMRAAIEAEIRKDEREKCITEARRAMVNNPDAAELTRSIVAFFAPTPSAQ